MGFFATENELLVAANTGIVSKVSEELSAYNINSSDYDGWTALMYASFGGHSDVVYFLVLKGADIHHKAKAGNTALLSAVIGEKSLEDFGKRADIVNLLISKGADPFLKNDNGSSPYSAASNKMKAVIEAALDDGQRNILKTEKETNTETNKKYEHIYNSILEDD